MRTKADIRLSSFGVASAFVNRLQWIGLSIARSAAVQMRYRPRQPVGTPMRAATPPRAGK